jgi:hypothetical protein
LKKSYPDVNVLAVFRNPAERAWSHYWMWHERRAKVGKARLIVPFERMFEDDGRWIRTTGHYATLLRRWREAFPDMGVFVYDDLVADPQAFMASIYRFIGVDDTFVGNVERRENSRQYRAMEQDTRQMLLAYYRDEIEGFFGQIGRKLPWLKPLE